MSAIIWEDRMRFIVIILVVLIPLWGCSKKDSEESKREDAKIQTGEEVKEKTEIKEQKAKESFDKVRPSALAGSWYPADKSQLTSLVRSLLKKAGVETEPASDHEKVFALVVPHAGYRFSGLVAAHGYKTLAFEDIRRVILLGPSHYSYFTGASISDVDYYETPLGKVPLDRETISVLRKNPLFGQQKDAHHKEHCLEIQLPFLQVVLEDFSIVPVLIGQVSKKEAQSIAESLKKMIDEETVVIVSSDFTHYGPNYGYLPFREQIEENIKDLNAAAFENIKSLDSDKFIEHKVKTGDTICGFNPLVVLLTMAEMMKGVNVTFLAYDTSGRIMNDFSNSVSYLSIALTRPVAADRLRERTFLNKQEQEVLLKLSRLTLQRHLNRVSHTDVLDEKFNFTENLKEPYGVFVTLKKHGQLRGCIGNIIAEKPLYSGVIDNTINAASNDTRFPPVTKGEENDIEIEISVLSQPEQIDSYREIVPGRDGIILSKEGRGAVFLPQVLVDNKWTPFTALRHLCHKAGLPYEAWREDTQFYVFSAQVFHETQ
jgi:AmmeMemoRadiSam system protein B/AmmeMemoRadiSam system protein A